MRASELRQAWVRGGAAVAATVTRSFSRRRHGRRREDERRPLTAMTTLDTAEMKRRAMLLTRVVCRGVRPLAAAHAFLTTRSPAWAARSSVACAAQQWFSERRSPFSNAEVLDRDGKRVDRGHRIGRPSHRSHAAANIAAAVGARQVSGHLAGAVCRHARRHGRIHFRRRALSATN